uniref:DNA-directed RNA polymerase subunit n=1 Tax=Pithovirus LCPAC403 TaxID=2506596 RepID=A0A481ZC37_9VIRU|nr:MAG: DNA-directed RNA polymerase subunit alpha [Pithovirus LCPAC403]
MTKTFKIDILVQRLILYVKRMNQIRHAPPNKSVRLKGEINLEDESKFYSFDLTSDPNNHVAHDIEANLPDVEISSFVQTTYDFKDLEKVALIITDPGEEGTGTVNSTHLGVTDNTIKCSKCGKNNLKCDGHLGLIKFAVPINHPFALEKDIITNILRSVCNSCACPMLSEKEMLFHGLIRRKDNSDDDFPYEITRRSNLHLKAMAKESAKAELCRCEGKCWEEQSDLCRTIEQEEKERPEYKTVKFKKKKKWERKEEREEEEEKKGKKKKPKCDTNPQLSKAESRRKASHENWNTGEIQFRYKSQKVDKWFIKSSESILKIFDCISDYTATLLGFTNGSHPRNLIMQGLPVFPPCGRPPLGFNDTRKENPLTYTYRTIVRLNNKLLTMIKSGRHLREPGEEKKKKRKKTVDDFQSILTKLKTKVRDLMLQTETQGTRSHETVTSIKTMITGKFGIIRRHMMGHRVNWSARTVLSVNANIDVDEIAIPEKFADELTREITVTYDNISDMKNLLRKGKIKTVMHKGQTRKKVLDANRNKIVLRVGDKVARPIQEGDYVIFSRQPVLHRFGFMAHKVRFWKALTIGIHISVTTPYGADFDGDEGTLHIPRSDEAFLEMKNIMSIRDCILGDKNNRPIISMIFHAPAAAYKLTAEKKMIDMYLFGILMSEVRDINVEDLLQRAIDAGVLNKPPEYLNKRIKMKRIEVVEAFYSRKKMPRKVAKKEYRIEKIVRFKTMKERLAAEKMKAKKIKEGKLRKERERALEILPPKQIEGVERMEIPDFIRDAISMSNSEADANVKAAKEEIFDRYADLIKDLKSSMAEEISTVKTIRITERIRVEKKNRDREMLAEVNRLYDIRDLELDTILKISESRKTIKPIPELFLPITLLDRMSMANMKIPGKIVFSSLLPKDMWYSSGMVLIENGILKKGAITAKHIGSASGSLVHELALDYRYNKDIVVNFISDGTRMLNKFLSNEGLSVGLEDCIPVDPSGELLKKKEEEIMRINALVSEEMSKPVNNPIEEARRERRILSHISSLKNLSLKYTRKNNNLELMLESGAKGNILNLTQIMDSPGQQYVNGVRLPLGLLDGKRCIPYFDYGEVGPASRGFCKNGFLVGMRPAESFFAHMGGRDSLMNTAIKTADIGDLQRKLAKSLEDIMVHQDGTVRDSSGKIYQFVYGNDGLNPTNLIRNDFAQGFIPFPININSAIGRLDYEFGGSVSIKFDEEHIDKILNSIPPIRCILQDMSENLTKNMKKTIHDHLIDLSFKPGDREDTYITKLAYDFQMMFKKANIESGTMVGVRASSSIGEPLTQLALSSFHQSGSSRNVTSGIEAVKEFLHATEPKTPSLRIIFDPSKVQLGVLDNGLRFPTTKDLFILRRKFVHLTVESLITKYDTLEFDEYDFWYDDYVKLTGTQKEREDPKWFMRLTMNVEKMVDYNITPYDIVDTFMDDINPMLMVIPSPMFMGIINLYPRKRQLQSSKFGGNEDNILIFLEKTVVESLSKTTVSGVLGIKDAFPTEEVVILGIMKEIKVDKNRWNLWYNKGHMNISGITENHIIHLLNVSGITITEETSDYIEVLDDWDEEKDERSETPLKYIRKLISKESEEEERFNIMQLKILIQTMDDLKNPPYLPVLEASRIKYLETDGANLLGVISFDGISKKSIMTTNLHETLSTLGIEALRTNYIQLFVQTLTREGVYVDLHHISLLADYVTHMGAFDPVTYSGMIKHKASMIDTASLEQANDHICEVSIYGNRDLISSVSTAIAVGTKAEIGYYYNRVNKKEKKEIDDIDMVSLDDLNEAFDNLDMDDLDDTVLGEAIIDDIEFEGEPIDKPVTISRERRVGEEALLHKFELSSEDEELEEAIVDLPEFEGEPIRSDYMNRSIERVLASEKMKF